MFASASARGLIVVILLTLVTSIPIALPAADVYGRPGEEEVDDAALTADGDRPGEEEVDDATLTADGES